MINDIVKSLQGDLDKGIEAFRRELAKVRTGRANLSVLDGVRVDYYGTPTPLNQIASLNVADARLITIKPWERSLIPEIEKSIRAAQLGLNPQSDGELVRLPMPALTQERRQDLVKVVKNALATSGMDAKKLQLEITETVLLQNTFSALATLHELRKMGVQIALDDFGTGYSSLSYLRSFPFDKIKIDQSFIQDMSNGVEPLAIVNAVAGLAKCLNMISTAEGVETQQQLETLQTIGCTEMQGYLFSKALPAKDVGRFFSTGSLAASDVA